MISTYTLAARTALGALAGQAAASNLFTSFAKAQLPALASAVSYTVLSRAGERATGVDTQTHKLTQKKVLMHLLAAFGTAYLTPAITSKLFNANVTTHQSTRMALANYAIHLIPGLFI